MNANAYLMFNGTCDAALKFYEKTIGAKVEMKMTFADSPMKDQCTPGSENHILHARFKVGEVIVMCSDCPEGRYEKPAGFSMALNPATPEEAEKVFNALVEKGSVTMPLAETFWAQKFGMLVDQFGVPWMINCEQKRG